ncbi:hypothetical protein APY03_0877 [Variovorax sp. WDL1]|nr:hypothetical protein APY03_0877 [Variovorax sp. WDL1]
MSTASLNGLLEVLRQFIFRAQSLSQHGAEGSCGLGLQAC